MKLLALAFVLAPLTARADHAKLSDADVQVVAELHHANQSEVAMANYALAHGTKSVKTYASMIVKDHSANDKDLTALAKQHSLMTIPDKKDDSDDMAKLKAVKGAELDRVYVDMMVMDHEKDIKKVSDAIGSVSDTDLRGHLSKTKPVLEKHLDDAKMLQKSNAQAAR